MRYLWVEDFNVNENNETDKELEKHLIEFFDLENDELIIKGDLTSAIEFLEVKDNFSLIDAVLIDIRFPMGIDKEIYNKYYKDIVTLKFFEENMNDASGIMLYLLLIFRYHFSQKKMAFLSANIGKSNQKLSVLQDMIEIIAKSKFDELSYSEKKSYRTLERNLGKDILGISSKDKEWETFISGEEQIQNIDEEELMRILKRLPEIYREKFEVDTANNSNNKSLVKYQLVKEQFEKIGFVMPAAFEKHKIGERATKRYSFLQWEAELYEKKYVSIRSNILELLKIIEQEICDNDIDKYVQNFVSLLTCNKDELQEYDKDFFLSYISDLKELFIIDGENEDSLKCSLLLKEMSSLWEATAIPLWKKLNSTGKCRFDRKGEQYIEDPQDGNFFNHNNKHLYSYHATMKIVRNWSGHQGINNININDIGFLMIINLRGIFDISLFSKKNYDNYLDYERKLIDVFGSKYLLLDISKNLDESKTYFCNLNDKTKKNNGNSEDIYGRISGIGHSNSRIRREVNMDEIYMLFFHSIYDESIEDKQIEYLTDSITERTWDKWKDRYNNRFGEYCKI